MSVRRGGGGKCPNHLYLCNCLPPKSQWVFIDIYQVVGKRGQSNTIFDLLPEGLHTQLGCYLAFVANGGVNAS
jgi:hypothetical protein